MTPTIESILAQHRAELRRYFRILSRISIAGGALAATACSSFDPGLYERPACGGGGASMLEEGALGGEHDWLAVFLGAGTGDRTPSRQTGVPDQSLGERCRTAADREACETDVMSALASGFEPIVMETQGATIRGASTPEQLNMLLGPVDSREDAMLRVRMQGYDVSCMDPQRGGVREVAGGFEVVSTRYTASCDPIELTRFVLFVDAEGAISEVSREVIERMDGACIGRRPEGLLRGDRPRGGRSRAGLWLAGIAHLEAAAVPAFERVARDLAALRAPRALIEDARAAADDEVRHARAVGKLARARGSEPAPVRLAPTGRRDLFALAHENVIEGCVRETFGALSGTYQAMAAADADVRAVMATIAEDETRHAALSHALHAWAMPQLTVSEQRALVAARRAAIETLRAEASVPKHPEVARAVGLPTPEIAVRWVDRLASDLALAA